MYTYDQIKLARAINAGLALARMLGYEEGYVFLRKLAHDNLKEEIVRTQTGSMLDGYYVKYVDDELGLSWLEAGFMPECVTTDEGAKSWCNSHRLVVDAPYDCTGQEFTRWMHWHRNPCGRYSYICREEIDC